MAGQRTRDVKDQHLARLEAAAIKGGSPTRIVRAYARECEITTRQAWSDLKLVRKRWQQYAQLSGRAGTELGRALVIRDVLFRDAVLRGDFAAALDTEKDRCKLLGLYPGRTVVSVARPAPTPALGDTLGDDVLADIAATAESRPEAESPAGA